MNPTHESLFVSIHRLAAGLDIPIEHVVLGEYAGRFSVCLVAGNDRTRVAKGDTIYQALMAMVAKLATEAEAALAKAEARANAMRALVEGNSP